MKKLIFWICGLFLVFSTGAFACDPGDPTCSMIDVKGYGNQFADYSTGVVDVGSTIQTYSSGYSKDWTGFTNTIGDPCPDGNCGMGINQGNYSYEKFSTNSYTTVSQKSVMGSGNMNSLGGLAACQSNIDGVTSIPFTGSLYQTHSIDNKAYGPVGGGINANANYSGTQTLNLKVGGY